MTKDNPYRARGTLVGKSYIERDADTELRAAIRDNDRYPFILAPRQSGKSSIMERTKSLLAKDDLRIVIIDLSIFSRKILKDFDHFIFDFITVLYEKLGVSSKLVAHLQHMRSQPMFLLDSIQLLLQSIKGRIVVCIDELDILLVSEFKDDFLSQLRALFNERASEQLFKRIQFILAAAVPLDSLISDRNRSPFNVGEQIILHDFNKEQVERLVEVGEWLNTKDVKQVSERIIYWTSGSVFLSQCILEKAYRLNYEKAVIQDICRLIDGAAIEIINSAPYEIHFRNIEEQLRNHPHLLWGWKRWMDGIVPNKGIIERLFLAGISDYREPIRNMIYRGVFLEGGTLSIMPEAEKPFKYDIFLSYSTEDKDKVHALAQRLKKDGLRVWLDVWAIRPGDSVPFKIKNGLESSRILLICMSPAYFSTKWKMLEGYVYLFLYSTNAERRFIPLLAENCTLPDNLTQFAYVDWRTPSNEEYSKLLATCRRVTDRVYIIGRKKEIHDFSRWLHDFDHAMAINDNVLLICIWGFGGVGKTTLLKKFGDICESENWFITRKDEYSPKIQVPHPAEPLSMFLSRIQSLPNDNCANEFEIISKFVLSLPSNSALLIDEFRADDVDFVKSFEWMVAQMASQANHRYVIITSCRPKPRFKSSQVDHYIGSKLGLPPLTLEETREFIEYYYEGDPRNNYINKIFDITHGNPKVIAYFYANSEISNKILSSSDPSTLSEIDVIRATWEYVREHENLCRVADIAAVAGMVSITCPNDIFDESIENWYEIKKDMLDRSLLEYAGSDTYKIHDLLRDYHYINMRNAVKQELHQVVGNYYEIKGNQPDMAMEHYVLAGYKGGIRRVYRAANKIMEANSDYRSIIRIVGKYIDTFSANDEFDIDLIIDRGMAYRILADYQFSLQEFKQALLLCDQLSIIEKNIKRANILWGLGETHRRLDHYEESLEFYNKAIQIYRNYEKDDGKDGVARCERGKSAVYKMISRYQESIQGYKIAGNIYREMNNLDGLLYCERGIAAVHMLQGHYIKSQKGYLYSLHLYRKSNNPRGIAYACWGYAESLRFQSEIETAIKVYSEAFDLSNRIGDEWSAIYLSLNLAECYRAKREYNEAHKWHSLIEGLRAYQNSPVLQAHYILATAELQRLEGKTADYELYKKAERMYQEVPMGLRWGIAHSRIGFCLAELRTLKDYDNKQWEDRMNSIIEYCIENQLPNELQTAKRIIEEKNPDELHPLSFP